MAEEKPAAPAEEEKKPDAAPEGEAEAKEESAVAPIIIKKVMDDGHGGAHGGAWKIALADMMTAMMAFFLLMWLLGATTEDQRKSIAEYFQPTSHSNITTGKLAGSDGMFGGRSIIDPDGFPYSAKQTALMEMLTPRSQGGPTENDPAPNSEERSDPTSMSEVQKKQLAEPADQANFEKLAQQVRESLATNPTLQNLKDQVQFSREKEGLRIEIIDKADFAMFGLGTTGMTPKAQSLVKEVAKSLQGLDNKLAIRGHTDSVAFANSDGRNNWSLSAERAESTRKMLEAQGVKTERFAKIEGVADTAPYNPNDPKDPRNRRISVTVMYRD